MRRPQNIASEKELRENLLSGNCTLPTDVNECLLIGGILCMRSAYDSVDNL